MPKGPYMPKDDNGKADLFDNLASKVGKYATTLDISAADVTAVQNDAAWFRYTLNTQKMQSTGQQWTAYKNLVRDGGTGDPTPPAAPTLPTPAPSSVPPGILARMTSLIARIKKHKNYTDAIGQDLNIIGAAQTTDEAAMKPILDVQMQAGRPSVLWTKGDADSLEIWVDRGDGKGFVFLAVDTQPDYPDTTPLPFAGMSALWKYKAIYRIADEQVGQWSDVISVTVAG